MTPLQLLFTFASCLSVPLVIRWSSSFLLGTRRVFLHSSLITFLISVHGCFLLHGWFWTQWYKSVIYVAFNFFTIVISGIFWHYNFYWGFFPSLHWFLKIAGQQLSFSIFCFQFYGWFDFSVVYNLRNRFFRKLRTEHHLGTFSLTYKSIAPV